jgi:outer membrane protein OmpA-like peptidoglycan-associated protein
MTDLDFVPAPPSIHSKRAMLHNASMKLLPLLIAAALSGCATKALHSSGGPGSPNAAGSKSAAADSRAAGAAGASSDSTAGDMSAQPGGPAGQVEGANGASAQGAGGQNGTGSDTAAGSSSASDGTTAGAKSGGAGGQSSAFADGGTGVDGGTDTTGGTAAQSADGTSGTGAGGTAERNADGTSGQSADGTSGAGAGGPNGAGGVAGAGTAGAGAAGEGAAGAEGMSANASNAGTGGPGTNGAGGDASGVAGTGEGADGNSASGMAGAESAGGDSRVASIDVPSGNVKVDEDYRPQTLNGMLPLVLGVNEDGRFDFDQYALRPEVKKALDNLADQLKSAEYDRLDILGYTDRIGTTEYNKRLSELRAWSVAQYLIAQGVPENKIRYEGRGDKNPITQPDECTGLARGELITCLQKDRRVEIEASIHRKHATVIQ